MSILYICMHNPFGNKGGGNLASHAYLRAFSEFSDGSIDVVCSSALNNQIDSSIRIRKILFAPDRTAVGKIFSVFTGYMNRYIDFSKHIIHENGSSYDLVVFDHNGISGPLVKLAKSRGLKTITIHHNYEKEFFHDNNSGLYRKLFIHHVVHWERLAYLESDMNLFLTKQDLEKFGEVYGTTKAKNFVIGAFEYKDYTRPEIVESSTKTGITLAITGSLCVPQTIDGIRYFFSELYEKVPNDCHIIVAGRNPVDEIRNLCASKANVSLIPDPIDMNAVIGNADIYVCPIRLGGGLKLRVMDGLRNGIPVLTHDCSARGFDAFFDEEIFRSFSSSEEFASKLSNLLELIYCKKYTKTDVQQIFKDAFSFEAGLKRVVSAIDLLYS